ncbi:unnamed protein product, partial [Heterotrigona itama]
MPTMRWNFWMENRWEKNSKDYTSKELIEMMIADLKNIYPHAANKLNHSTAQFVCNQCTTRLSILRMQAIIVKRPRFVKCETA